MATPLRPLSLGEILDRTFTLYRKHFVLFVGIAAVMHLVLLVMKLVPLVLTGAAARSTGLLPGVVLFNLAWALVTLVVWLIAYAMAQGATVHAVSAVYLEEPIGVKEAYARVRDKVGRIILVMV